ncbi:MAG TPA: hypothetical protein VFD37_07075 [Solirubrobacterales bacterium]|nr:hypothetical protein [Solirubrobacterales bacterium]
MSLTDSIDISLQSLLDSMRGEIVEARIGHPEVLLIDIIDSVGGRWQLMTQDAEWEIGDPESLVGRRVLKVALDDRAWKLRLELAGEDALVITPGEHLSSSDPPNWEVITPEGSLVEFGPGAQWRIGDHAARTFG